MSGLVNEVREEGATTQGHRPIREAAPENHDEAAKQKAQIPGPEPRDLPVHNFPTALVEEKARECAQDRNPDIWLYRDRTIILLKRYMRLALETGRLPSIFGRELFRAKVTAYTGTSFEDRVIFVHDVEKCLERLDPFDRGMIARVLLQEHDHEQAARLLHCTRKTIERRMPELLDELSEEFLKVGLLSRFADAN